MQTIQNIINSEAFWTAIAVIVGYLANTVASRGWVAKLAPTSPWRRVIRLLHGFVDKIDPAIIIVALTLPLLTSCALFRGAVVAGQDLCRAELAQSQDVRDEAQIRKIPTGELVDAFCGLVDVAAIFSTEARSGLARPALTRQAQAVALLKSKGEL